MALCPSESGNSCFYKPEKVNARQRSIACHVAVSLLRFFMQRISFLCKNVI